MIYHSTTASDMPYRLPGRGGISADIIKVGRN